MTDHHRLVGQVRSRIGAVLGLRLAVTVLSGWLVLWGVAVLILRGVFGVSWEPLVWGLVGIPVAALIGIITGIRRAPPAQTVRALLDHHWDCGGLLMSAAETDPGKWNVTPQTTPLPKVRWNGQRSLGILTCCAAFLMASFFVPAQIFSKIGPERLVVDKEVEQLAEKINLLKEEQILPEERAQSLEEALERLRQEALGRDPAKTWEAMDHLERSIAKASAEAAEQASRDAKAAAESEELAAAIDQARQEMTPGDLADAMEALVGDLAKSLKESALLSNELSQELKEALAQGKLDPAQLKELAKSLGECKKCELDKLGELAKARMIDPSLLEAANKACQLDPDALAKFLAECQGNGELKQCLASGKLPGRGGVSRGRGDAAMTWGDGSQKEDVKFRESILPPAAVSSLKDSKLQGLSLSSPMPDESNPASSGGALDPSRAGRGSARTQIILPEHRKVIERYFSRGSSPAPKSGT